MVVLCPKLHWSLGSSQSLNNIIIMRSLDLTAPTSALEHTDFSNLLGAPIKACVDAQVQAAQATADYIDRVCFKYNPDSKAYETVTITFRYTTDEGDKRITLPLVSVMPIPYLQINHVNLKFAADVSVGDSGRLTAKVSTENGNTNANGDEEKSTDYSNEIKIGVNIHATSSDMPMGVAKLLEFMQQNIHAKEVE